MHANAAMIVMRFPLTVHGWSTKTANKNQPIVSECMQQRIVTNTGSCQRGWII